MATNDLNFNLFDDDYVLVDFESNQDPDIQDTNNTDVGEAHKEPEIVADGEEDAGGDPNESGNESLPNLYSSLAKALGEEGFLPSLDSYDEIDSFDKLGERIKEANKKALAESLGFGLDEVNELNDLQKEYLKALAQGVPAETFIETKRNELGVDSITDEQIESDEELRRNILINSYTSRGFTPEKAAKLAQVHIDLAEDVEEAKSAMNDIRAAVKEASQKEIEYQRQLKEDQIKQYKEYEENLKKHFYNTEKIGETFEVTKQLRDRMYESITKPVAKTEDGTLVNAITKYQIENPIDFQHKVAWLYSITDGFKKFDSFVGTKAKSSAARELESVLNSTNFDKLGNVSNIEHDDEAVYGFRDYRFDEDAL